MTEYRIKLFSGHARTLGSFFYIIKAIGKFFVFGRGFINRTLYAFEYKTPVESRLPLRPGPL